MPGAAFHPDLVHRGVSADAAPGKWVTRYKSDREPIADLKQDRTYRICNDGPGSVELIVDGTALSEWLNAGECRDVEGKKVEVHQVTESDAKGTYESL